MVGGAFIFNSITEKSLGVEERGNAMGADMGSAESVEDMCARLRAKYTTRAGGAPDGGCPAAMEVGTAHSEQSTADTFRRATREREVRCCPKCQGSRELREDYNFRVIYRECDECDGEGTIIFDSSGKRVMKVCECLLYFHTSLLLLRDITCTYTMRLIQHIFGTYAMSKHVREQSADSAGHDDDGGLAARRRTKKLEVRSLSSV